MINLSKLLCCGERRFSGDCLRYGRDFNCPVVVWHLTGECNLKCRHCYSAVPDAKGMSSTEVALFLAHLASIRPPALLFSGGEPLMHPRFFEYLARARACGLNVSLSTNGTLIDRIAAEKIAGAGVGYVGVSLDGAGDSHDEFRGVKGAFDAALKGIENLIGAGCMVGFRVTLARPVLPHLPEIFSLSERYGVSRVCFYHFVPSGRGAGDASLMPDLEEERSALRGIFDWTDRAAVNRKPPIEVLTAGDASDGPLLYEYLLRRKPERAPRALEFLRKGAQRGIGRGIASVRWDGALFSNQFAWGKRAGSWRDLPAKRPEARGAACLDCKWCDCCAGSLRLEKGRCCMMTEEERCGNDVA